MGHQPQKGPNSHGFIYGPVQSAFDRTLCICKIIIFLQMLFVFFKSPDAIDIGPSRATEANARTVRVGVPFIEGSFLGGFKRDTKRNTIILKGSPKKDTPNNYEKLTCLIDAIDEAGLARTTHALKGCTWKKMKR